MAGKIYELVHGAWRAEAVSRADQLRGEIATLAGAAGSDVELLAQASERIDGLFDRGTSAAGDPEATLRRLRIAVVWDALHDAEELVDRAQVDVAVLTRRAGEHARTNLPLAQAEAALATLAAAPDAATRADRARDVIVRSHAVTAHRLETMRNSSRLTSALAGISWVAVGGLLLVQGLLLDDPVLPMPPDDPTEMTPVVFLLLVLVLGAVGGLVSAITYARNDRVDTRWFNPAPALVAIKISCGALFGVLGTLLVAAEIVPAVTYRTLPQVLVLALVFGYAQHAVTRVLDRYTDTITEPPAAAATVTAAGTTQAIGTPVPVADAAEARRPALAERTVATGVQSAGTGATPQLVAGQPDGARLG